MACKLITPYRSCDDAQQPAKSHYTTHSQAHHQTQEKIEYHINAHCKAARRLSHNLNYGNIKSQQRVDNNNRTKKAKPSKRAPKKTTIDMTPDKQSTPNPQAKKP